MSDFKFNCPNCGQHLSGDERYSGLQITCPACAKPLVVPSAPTAAAPAIARSAPPGPGARPQAVPGRPQKTCGLAIASLICSIGSFIIIPFGFIPGIICGHMAKKKIAATPGLQGRGLAKAGLIVGYIALGINVLVVLAVATFFVFFATRIQQMRPVAGSLSQPPVSRSLPQPPVVGPQRGGQPPELETTDTEPDGSGWTMKLTGVEIPSRAVTGRIHGQPFKLEKVTLQNGFLNLVEGQDFFADREMDVVIFENDLTKLSGRTFTVPKQGFGISPYIYMKWKEGGGNSPKQRSFIENYALRLEFGALSGGKLPGKIYLCLPDKEKSFVAGTFEVPAKGSR
jgi:Domain of unknown function (DUF4190)